MSRAVEREKRERGKKTKKKKREGEGEGEIRDVCNGDLMEREREALGHLQQPAILHLQLYL
jgi:hypothetical protein